MNTKEQKPTILENHLNACRKVIYYSLGLSLVGNLLLLALPIYSLQVLDRVISSGSTETLAMLTVVVVGALIALGLIQMARSFISVRMGEWLEKKLSPALFSHSISSSVLAMGKTGGTQQLRDLSVIKNFIAGQTLTALLDAPWSLIFIAILFMIHPINGFIAVGGGVALLILAIINDKITKPPLDASNEYNVKSMAQAEIAVRNAEAVEAMGMLSAVSKNWHKISAKGVELQTIASDYSSIIGGISKFLRFALQVAVIGVGGYLVLQGELTVGAIIAGSILISRALAPFEASITSWKGFVSARKSYTRLQESLNKFSERAQTMELPAPEGNLSVEDVYFKPAGAEKPTLKAINFKLNAGEILGMVGPSAAGKSTLAKIITGVWKPVAGVVRLDNADVYSWDRENFGHHVGYLPQDVELFNGSIKDNIARMRSDADAKDVIEAAKAAGVHKMILSLPAGYDTEIGISGSILSAGQRQRVGLARAFFGNPKLIVLDEPNANLDSEGEQALLVALKYAKSKKITTIIISHRPSLMSAVDKMLVLRDGVTIAFGSREEVMKQMNTGGKVVKAKKPAAQKPANNRVN